jgi:hypothetical protein
MSSASTATSKQLASGFGRRLPERVKILPFYQRQSTDNCLLASGLRPPGPITRHSRLYSMYPNFLVIGAQKAGTTWLDRNLRTHPQIWLPPEKEIHFFDLPRPLPFAALRHVPDRSVRHWALHRLQRDLAKVERGEQSEEWYNRYYYSLRSWSWYDSLFTPGTGQICGEATPRYAVLPRRQISAIHRRMPNLKIIYLLREPIDRMWSDLAMFQDQRFGGEGTQHVSKAADSNFLSKPGNLRHSRYEENIRRWETFFPTKQIFIGFLEEVEAQPADLLRRIFEFLGVDAAHQVPADLAGKKINFADYPPTPHQTSVRLAQALVNDTRRLHQRLSSAHTSSWLEKVEGLVSSEHPALKMTTPA